MIQVLGLRDYTTKGVLKKRECFFDRGWRFNSIDQVFDPAKVQELVAQVPEKERFNLYFTVADCYEEAGRKLKEQWAIPFDIDNLAMPEGGEHASAEQAARLGAEALGVPYEDMGVVFTGNGVQFFIQLKTPVLDDAHFDRTRAHYSVIAKRIQNLLSERGVQGNVDTSVWSKGRLMRLPYTENRKPNKPTRQAVILCSTIKPQAWDIFEQSGITAIKDNEVVTDVALKNYPKPDTKAVCDGCKFLVHCKSDASKVSEPQWYAMLSVTSRLDDGRNLSHEYSQGHNSYNHYETENKIDQALVSSGPRTCASIDAVWGECSTCEYHGKVTSPIMIKGADYIGSSDFGYRERKITKEGVVLAGKPAYLDLIKTFEIEHPYRSVVDHDAIYVYNNQYWVPLHDQFVRNWMRTKVRHHPTSAEMNEFLAVLKAENVYMYDDFNTQSHGKMNFSNCVLDIQTMVTTPHSPTYGFFNALPFPYDPRATAPRWEKFLLEVMDNDSDMAELLKEFGGYAISGDSCWYQKALVLLGDGANGKSVFLEMLGEVVGDESHSAISLSALGQDTMRYQLVNKLFNYSEETNVRALADSDLFKALVVGGKMTVKQLYVQPYQVSNRAKIILAANDMPRTTDNTHGLYRRLIIVPFNVRFTPGSPHHDYHIKDKLRAELPGIANSLIEAYKRFIERKVLIGDEKIQAIVEQYRQESDTVKLFLDTCVEYVEGAELKFSEFYEDYRMACDKLGRKWIGSTEFARQVYRNNPELEHARARVGGKVTRVIKGIKINKDF